MSKVKKPDAQQAAVPMSAMIDVVFLLLIYFVYTQKPIIEDVLLDVNLPAPDSRQTDTPPDVIRVGIDQHRQDNDKEFYYWFNGSTIPRTILERSLRRLADTNKNINIIVECWPSAKHQKLITLLDTCKTLGFKNISLSDMGTERDFRPDPIREKKPGS